ncbi:MAG: type II toxin-antitoxin system Phd/YefM family antitoxin [Deltaproteobacteria bacterium]|nr:type II toxin-antitoxin system Phd/YefM family antitoxin [Deltaproteobacteria bacterium]
MLKKVSAMKARKNLGQLMNEVALRGDDYIIERSGKALVAIISIEKYQALQKDRELALQALGAIGKKMGNEDSQMVEQTIIQAVKEARAG